MDTRSLSSMVKQPWHEPDPPLPPTAEIKKECCWSFSSQAFIKHRDNCTWLVHLNVFTASLGSLQQLFFYMGFCQLSDSCIRNASANKYKVYLGTVFLILQDLWIFVEPSVTKERYVTHGYGIKLSVITLQLHQMIPSKEPHYQCLIMGLFYTLEHQIWWWGLTPNYASPLTLLWSIWILHIPAGP